MVLSFRAAIRAGQGVQRQEQEWRQKKQERDDTCDLEADRFEGDGKEEAEEDGDESEIGGEG